MNIVATRHTRQLARKIIATTSTRGAQATLALLPRVDPGQIPALIAALAEEAAIKPHMGPTKRKVTAARGQAWRQRIAEEDAKWTEEDARRAHAAYTAGSRADFAITGERVYQRQSARRYREQKRAAA